MSYLLLAVACVILRGSAGAQARVFEPPCHTVWPSSLLPASALLRTADMHAYVSRGCGTVCILAVTVVMWRMGQVSLQCMHALAYAMHVRRPH